MKRVWYLAALSALALAACDEASSPAPTPGTVVANVFVDTDLSGSLSPDDVVPEGLTVTLVAVEGGAAVQSAEVGEDGTATFADVMPGAYRVQIGGTAPAGSVLTGSEAPSAVIPYTGGTVEVDFRFVYFPGSISGRVYRDDNGDGNYDAGVDTPGDGLTVTLLLPLEGGEDAAIDEVTTDAEGLYEFPILAPQTFKLEFQAVGEMDYGEAGAVRTVVVPPNTHVTYDVTFTGTPDVAITIAEARALGVGSNVIVRGFVTVPPNVVTFTSGGVAYTEIWLQDATGGIAALVLPASATDVALGDQIEVSGTISANGGALQVGGTGTVGAATIIELGANDVQDPVPLSFAEVAAVEHEGELVVTGPLVFDGNSTPSSSSGAFTAFMDKPDGTTIQLRIPDDGTGITPADFTLGQTYYVVGIMSRFNATPQIRPRSDADIIPVTISTIAEVRAAAAVDTVATVGVITAPPDVFTFSSGVNSEIWVQDETGGIAVFSVPSTRAATLAIGDSVDVLGLRGVFNGQGQIGGLPDLAVVVIERGGSAAPTPLAQAGAEIVSLAAEGRLVTTTLTITNVPTGTGSAFTVTASHADGTTGIQIRAATGTELVRADFVVGQTYQITGILTQFNGTPQIKPRGDADLVQQ